MEVEVGPECSTHVLVVEDFTHTEGYTCAGHVLVGAGDGLAEGGYDPPETLFNLRYQHVHGLGVVLVEPSLHPLKNESGIVKELPSVCPDVKEVRRERMGFDGLGKGAKQPHVIEPEAHLGLIDQSAER